MLAANKIVTREEAVRIVRNLKQAGKRVVFTNGCFDILHRGHIELLAFAREQGDLLIVGLNSDNSVRRLKGSQRPINTQMDRALVLAAIEYVDLVVFFEEDTPQELIASLVPDVLVKGGDYQLTEIVGRDVVERHGGKVVVFPLVQGYSTTAVVEGRMLQREKRFE